MTRQPPTTTAERGRPIAEQSQQATGADLPLVINGETLRTTCTTLAELLVDLEYDAAAVATAVNGDFVPATQRAGRALQPGDHIEVLSPRQGG